MMAIREELVASAAQFLRDPSVASSSIENRISFLQTKNLTQEEIDAALTEAGGGGARTGPSQPYYPPFPQHAWQPPPVAPRRDWRDWFIMATVVGGVGYGLYTLGKRYVYPLVSPPTPERLEQDKKSIEEQFDKAFALVEQLSKDTEILKDAEKKRTERLDTALAELETVMAELKSANRCREDDAQLILNEVQVLKDAIPEAMGEQKDLTDNRLAEINTELTSLKTLVSQRMSSGSTTTSIAGNYLRGVNGTTFPTTPGASRAATSASENVTDNTSTSPVTDPPKNLGQSNFNRVSGSSAISGAKASIPAWQMAMANQNTGATSSTKEAEKITKEPQATTNSS